MSMSPEEKIRSTIAAFCHWTDDGDFNEWVQLFTEDGCFRMFGNEVRGHAALRDFIEQDQPAGRRGLHLTTDSIITIADGRAVVRSNFIFIAAGETAAVMVTGGRYHDVLVPCGDAWLFKEREARLTFPVASVRWGATASASTKA